LPHLQLTTMPSTPAEMLHDVDDDSGAAATRVGATALRQVQAAEHPAVVSARVLNRPSQG